MFQISPDDLAKHETKAVKKLRQFLLAEGYSHLFASARSANGAVYHATALSSSALQSVFG